MAMKRSIVCGSVTNAIKAKNVLESQGIKVYVERLPRASEIFGCGYCVTVPSGALNLALEILNSRGIKYKGVLDAQD